MAEKLQYITDEQGERVGVILDLAEYQRLANLPSPDLDFLVGLSQAELQALADSKLAPTAQTRLDDLLARQDESTLSLEEIAELDHLLEQVDQLNVLKTRARYTLLHYQTTLVPAA
jgi:uncharacterized protein with von Willebrand factor type A (vWA) domain